MTAPFRGARTHTTTPSAFRAPRRVLPVRLEEATVQARPLCCCEILPRGLAGRATINAVPYAVEFNATLPAEGEPVVFGYRLTNAVNGHVYDVDAGLTHCSCPDFLFRRGTAQHPHCKHLLAARRWREAGEL